MSLAPLPGLVGRQAEQHPAHPSQLAGLAPDQVHVVDGQHAALLWGGWTMTHSRPSAHFLSAAQLITPGCESFAPLPGEHVQAGAGAELLDALVEDVRFGGVAAAGRGRLERELLPHLAGPELAAVAEQDELGVELE